MDKTEQTLRLEDAANFLHMSPATLRRKAKNKEINASKPGKRWVFLVTELVAYLKQDYSGVGKASLSDCNKENALCHSINAATSGGSVSRHPVENEYVKLLGLKTKNRLRNTTTP
jgi:excisionase family DNA binding protein